MSWTFSKAGESAPATNSDFLLNGCIRLFLPRRKEAARRTGDVSRPPSPPKNFLQRFSAFLSFPPGPASSSACAGHEEKILRVPSGRTYFDDIPPSHRERLSGVPCRSGAVPGSSELPLFPALHDKDSPFPSKRNVAALPSRRTMKDFRSVPTLVCRRRRHGRRSCGAFPPHTSKLGPGRMDQPCAGAGHTSKSQISEDRGRKP